MEKPYAILSYRNAEKRVHVSAICDRFVFAGTPEYGGPIVLISALGPHSAVRGLLAAAATTQEIRCDSFPHGYFHGSEGGKSLTSALSREVTHGIYLGPSLLIGVAGSHTIAILEDDPKKVFQRLTYSFAIPALPDWAEWLSKALARTKKLTPLAGHGARGCQVSTSEKELDALLAEGVKSGALRF